MPPKRQSKKNAAPTGAASLMPLENFLMENGKDIDLDAFFKATQANLSNEEKAQDLFFEAMEAGSEEQELALITQALELDPDNTDARLWKLEHTYGWFDRVGELRGIIDTAARRLEAENGFKEYAGHFWGFIETRPYMRARQQLVHELLRVAQKEEAAKECEEMLELNPNDNQGMRYTLLTCYLSLNRQAEAKALFKKYREDGCVVFMWGDVLLRWLSPRKTGLEKALAAAREQNAHIEDYLTGMKKLPKRLPPYYSMGSKEEAVCFAKDLITAWASHPGAREWLRSQSAENT